MDWLANSGAGRQWLRKYRYFLLILLLGILFMVIPEKKQEPVQTVLPQEAKQDTLEDALSDILSKIEGAGKVSVLLTEAIGEKTLYQTDQDITSRADGKDMRSSTVLVTNRDREETGLIQQITPPVYQGAVILCQGAGSSGVKLAIVEAVANATGLTTDKISVLKMK